MPEALLAICPSSVPPAPTAPSTLPRASIIEAVSTPRSAKSWTMSSWRSSSTPTAASTSSTVVCTPPTAVPTVCISVVRSPIEWSKRSGHPAGLT